MNKNDIKKHLQNKIIFLFFILTPLFSAILFCLKDGRTISDIYIPLGGWSDEITYYKQIEGILSHGMPRGFFGYNQSRALYGPLGVWGLIPLVPYVIWGFFFGWSYCAPIYANIFFSVIALCVFYILLRPNPKCMAIFSLFWIVNQFINRYVLSGVVEASVFMQLMIVIACGEYLLSSKIREQNHQIFSPKKDLMIMLCCTFFICFLTLARPYFAVLFLIPLWKALKDKRKIWIIGLPFVTIIIMILFFINNFYFCSTYFENVLSFDTILSRGFTGFFTHLFYSLIEIAKLIWYAIRYKGSGVGWYYLLLLLELLVMFCTCIYRKYRHKEVPKMFISTLIGNSLILLSIIEMYDLGVGARHILALTTVNAVLLIIETHFSWGGILAAICLFSIIQTQGADGLPYKNDDYTRYMNTLETEFSDLIHVTDELSYDNVVAMPTADRHVQNPEQYVSTYYGLMYAMPAGVGISLDFEDFYDVPENIKAKYILVHPNGQIRNKLDSLDMQCIFENEELALYSK